jgi:hypothetical protein
MSRLPPTNGKAAQRPSSAASQTTHKTPEACADSGTALANLKTKLLNIAGLLTVELIGGLVVLALWGGRYV